MIFIYQGGDAGGGYGEYRIIPTDDRTHDPRWRSLTRRIWGTRWDAGKATRLCSTPSRSSIRHGWGAAVSSTPSRMHVVERFTRQGDVLLYDVTVEDPEVLVEPWVLPTRTVVRNANPNAGLPRARQLRGSGVRSRRVPDSALVQ